MQSPYCHHCYDFFIFKEVLEKGPGTAIFPEDLEKGLGTAASQVSETGRIKLCNYSLCNPQGGLESRLNVELYREVRLTSEG